MGRKFDFDVASGKEVSKLDGHSGGVMSVAFSPDGAKVVSGSDDKSVRMWNVGNSPDGAKIVDDSAVRVRGGHDVLPLLLIAQFSMLRFSCVQCRGPAQHTSDTLPGLWGCLELGWKSRGHI